MTDPPNMCSSVSMTAVEYSLPAALSAAVGRSEHEHIFKTANTHFVGLAMSSENKGFIALWESCQEAGSAAVWSPVKPY